MSSEDWRVRVLERLHQSRRSPIELSGGAVRYAHLEDDCSLPLVISPAMDGLELAQWAGSHWEEVIKRLEPHGAILFRGFEVRTPQRLEAVVRATSGELLPYLYGSTPRRPVQGLVYTSTDYPADQAIPMHSEMSYTSSWPLKIWFACVQPAASGGETPLADVRMVLRSLDPALVDEFRDRGVLYTRTFLPGIGPSISQVFQADDSKAVEQYCRANGIAYEWVGNGGLRTRQTRPAVARHKRTREEVWFNQAHLFHVTALPDAVREALLSSRREEDLPRNAYFGDGSRIPEASLAAVRAAYQENRVMFPWHSGDAVLVDNMLVAHGRMPFRGQRSVIVAMAESCSDAG